MSYSPLGKPRWQRDLERFLPLKSQFVLSGNVRDFQAVEVAGAVAPLPANLALAECLRAAHYEVVLFYDPVFGFRTEALDGGHRSIEIEFMRAIGLAPAEGIAPAGLDLFRQTITRFVEQRDRRAALVVDYASRIVVRSDAPSRDEHQLFAQSLILSHLASVGSWLDRFAAQSEYRSDFGELARRALLGTLSARIGSELPGLFGADSTDVQRATARMGSGQDFALAARTFFGRLTADTLASWLDRTLSAHIGPGRRFAHLGERAAFDSELDHFCAEATRIIREFSGGWYWNTLNREGRIATNNAAGFAAIAFKKIVEELHRKRA